MTNFLRKCEKQKRRHTKPRKAQYAVFARKPLRRKADAHAITVIRCGARKHVAHPKYISPAVKFSDDIGYINCEYLRRNLFLPI